VGAGPETQRLTPVCHKARPTNFQNGVSNEFGSFCDRLETEIQKKSCLPANQPSVPPDYHADESFAVLSEETC
jgi:hypothetical protein